MESYGLVAVLLLAVLLPFAAYEFVQLRRRRDDRRRATRAKGKIRL